MSIEVPSVKVWSAQAVSSTTTYYSGSRLNTAPAANPVGTDMKGATSISFIGVITGTPGATLTIEVSNSDDNDIRLGQDVWITEDSFTGAGFTAGVATVTSGQINSSANFAIRGICRFKRIRLKWINASSSGTVTVSATVKGTN